MYIIFVMILQFWYCVVFVDYYSIYIFVVYHQLYKARHFLEITYIFVRMLLKYIILQSSSTMLTVVDCLLRI